MKIQSLNARNCRGIVDGPALSFGDGGVFIFGDNGTGKSSYIDALVGTKSSHQILTSVPYRVSCEGTL
jgi:recombinational DNA repair ATPase RecF